MIRTRAEGGRSLNINACACASMIRAASRRDESRVSSVSELDLSPVSQSSSSFSLACPTSPVPSSSSLPAPCSPASPPVPASPSAPASASSPLVSPSPCGCGRSKVL